jgi:hypothetical protein
MTGEEPVAAANSGGMRGMRGMQVAGYRIGLPGHEKELALLLLSRVEMLDDFANDMLAGGPEDQG